MSSEVKVVLVVVAMVALTPTALLLSYTDWDDLPGYRLEVFHRWPWFRVSLLLTGMTCLGAYAAARRWEVLSARPRGVSDDSIGEAGAWAFLAVPVLWWLVYPGISALGLHSDPSYLHALAAVALIQSIGFFLLTRQMRITE